MPVDTVINLTCPHCYHRAAHLCVKAETVATVTCSRCDYSWAVELAALPTAARQQIDVASAAASSP